MPDVGPPAPTRYGEVLWLQPYPDVLLEGVIDQAPGPESRYEAREAISLAFVTALQLLPPRQRAVLILRDVLGFHACEVAEMLDATEESVKSALKRARGTLRSHLADRGTHEPAPPPGSAAERAIVARLARAYEAGDVDGIVELLTDDVWLTMPPTPLEYHGRELAVSFLKIVSLRAPTVCRRGLRAAKPLVCAGRLTIGSPACRLVPSSRHGHIANRPRPDSKGCAPFDDGLSSTCSTDSTGRKPDHPERRSKGMPSYPLLQGKRAVVFGAGGSIGSEVVKAFASGGRRGVLGRPERGESQGHRLPGTRFELSVHLGPAPSDKQVQAGTRPAG